MTASLSPDQKRIYIADIGHHRTRMVDLASGIITTVAGNGQGGLPKDGSPALESPTGDTRAVAQAKDGTLYWVDTSIIPVVDEDGKTAQFISIRADISDRKYAEQLLEQTATDLEDRNLELADARDHALAATHAKQ